MGAQDLNKLNAQLMKAEMMGDSIKAAELKSAIASIQSVASVSKSDLQRSSRDEESVEVISNIDSKGRVLTSLSKKYDLTRDDLRSGSRNGKVKKENLINKDSTKRGYFTSDVKSSELSIKELMRNELSGDISNDLDDNYARNIINKGSGYRDARESRFVQVFLLVHEDCGCKKYVFITAQKWNGRRR
jgi:hypothetical protein